MVMDPRYLGSLNYGGESYANPQFPGLGYDYSGGLQSGISLASPYSNPAPSYPGLGYDPYGGLQTLGSLGSQVNYGVQPILPFTPSYTSQISGIYPTPQTAVQQTLDAAGLAPTGADLWRQLQYNPPSLNMNLGGSSLLPTPAAPPSAPSFGAPLTLGPQYAGVGQSWGGNAGGVPGFGGTPTLGGSFGTSQLGTGAASSYGGAGGYSPGAQRQRATQPNYSGYGGANYGQPAGGGQPASYTGGAAGYGQQPTASSYGQPYQAGQYNYAQAGGATQAGAGGGQYAAPIGPNTIRGTGKWMPGRGIDLFARRGEPIYAIQDGTVEAVGGIQSPAGQVGSILLRGQDGINAQYTHVQPSVPPGRVRKGQQIGVVGDSSMDMLGAYPGMPDGFQHLDFQVGHGGPWMIVGGDIDANQFLSTVGYRGQQIQGSTRGPNGAGGGMGQGGFPGFGGMPQGFGPGAQQFNPMSLFGGGGQGGFGGGYGQGGFNPAMLLGQGGFGGGFGFGR